MDICAGGTINAGATSITFTNHHMEQCTITSCGLPGWPTTPPVVPGKQGNNPGTKVVDLTTPATVGNYPYTPNCCPQAGSPEIKVQ